MPSWWLCAVVLSAVPYRLDAPEQTFVLPQLLDEASDLALAADQQSVWTIDDERGAVYRVSLSDGRVVQTIDFHAKGDFEGVAMLGPKVVAARSDGTLYLIDPPSGTARRVPTRLSGACNLEGIAAAEPGGPLLLACKTPSGDRHHRGWDIWAFDPDSGRLQRPPAVRITQKALDRYVALHPEQRGLDAHLALDPSAIAVQPGTGLLFILSSRASLLLIATPAGEVLHIEPLDRSVHRQPEGLAFLPDGSLLISSEARGARAVMMRFPPRREAEPPPPEPRR